MNKQTFKGNKGKTHTEKEQDFFDKDPHIDVEEVSDYLEKNYDPVMHYKNYAVVKLVGNDGYRYNGNKIGYQDGFARTKFVDSFGDEFVEEDGKLYLGECAGHLLVEIWGNNFSLRIETASGIIVEMDQMDIRLLKNLNNFLNYALNDRISQEKGEDNE